MILLTSRSGCRLPLCCKNRVLTEIAKKNRQKTAIQRGQKSPFFLIFATEPSFRPKRCGKGAEFTRCACSKGISCAFHKFEFCTHFTVCVAVPTNRYTSHPDLPTRRSRRSMRSSVRPWATPSFLQIEQMQQACPFELEGVIRRPPIARMRLLMVLPAHEFTFAFDRSMSAAALTPDNPSLGFELFGLTKLTGGFLDLGRVNHSRPGSFFASIFIFCPSSVRVPPVLRAAARFEPPRGASCSGAA